MARGSGGNTAIGLGIAGVAALFLVSGIQNKKLSQVLEGDIQGEPEELTEQQKQEAARVPQIEKGKFNRFLELEGGVTARKLAPPPRVASQWTWPSLRRAILEHRLTDSQVKAIIKQLEGKE